MPSEWTFALVSCPLVTLPGVLLNVMIVHISVYKVDKPYKWFLANLALTDISFALMNMVGQPILMFRDLNGYVSSLADSTVSVVPNRYLTRVYCISCCAIRNYSLS